MPVFPGNPSQEANARILIGVGKTLKAPQLALESMMCLGWGENDMTASGCNSSNHCGLFQLDSTWQAMHSYEDVAYWAAYAYEKGFYGYGGIIPIALAHPTYSPGYITNMCQGAYADLAQGAAYYDQYLTLTQETLAVLGDTAPVATAGSSGKAQPSQSSLHTQALINAIDDDDWSPWLEYCTGYLHNGALIGYRDSMQALGNCKGMSVFTEGGGR